MSDPKVEAVNKLKVSARSISKIQELSKEMNEIKTQIGLIASTILDNSELAGQNIDTIGFEAEHIIWRPHVSTPTPTPIPTTDTPTPTTERKLELVDKIKEE